MNLLLNTHSDKELGRTGKLRKHLGQRKKTNETLKNRREHRLNSQIKFLVSSTPAFDEENHIKIGY